MRRAEEKIEGDQGLTGGEWDAVHQAGHQLQCGDRFGFEVRATGQSRELEECRCGKAVAGGSGVVVCFLVASDQCFVVVRRVEESAIGLIPKLVEHSLSEAQRGVEVLRIEHGLVQLAQPVDQGRVVIKVRIETGAAVFVAVEEAG